MISMTAITTEPCFRGFSRHQDELVLTAKQQQLPKKLKIKTWWRSSRALFHPGLFPVTDHALFSTQVILLFLQDLR